MNHFIPDFGKARCAPDEVVQTYKLQGPRYREIPSANVATLRRSRLGFGAWCYIGYWLLVFGAFSACAANLTLQFAPEFNGVQLAFDSLTNHIVAGQKISVTRLDFLLSNIALHRTTGEWIEQTNWFAYVSPRGGRNAALLADVPAGSYDSMRFNIGVNPAINHQSVANHPAGHALNPDVNGLYWGWTGGYVFMALEGNWLRSDGRQSGFSYHIATDQRLMTVELPVTFQMSTDVELRMAINMERIFSFPNKIVINGATSSTHSRTNDPLAGQLRENIEHAFVVKKAVSIQPTPTVASTAKHIEMAAAAHPYRLTFSSVFPRPELPTDNPLTKEGVALGSRLFFDPSLSVNDSQSCASCHNPTAGFTDGRKVSLGAQGLSGTRNAMPLFNLAWKSEFFWDGRASSLREQVLQPIQNPREMHENLEHLTAKLSAQPEYPALFASAFGSPEITSDRLARALEQFLLTRISHDSKFDHMLTGAAKLTKEEQHGMELFHTEYDPRRGQFGADCFHCHGGPLFQSQNYANNGLDTEFADTGREIVTGREGDRGKFAVPSLRNVELTAPYMHDGRFKTLEEVVEHYCTGMKRSPTLDPNLGKHPDGGLPLGESDKHALVAFLKTLTDERYRAQSDTITLETVASSK